MAATLNAPEQTLQVVRSQKLSHVGGMAGDRPAKPLQAWLSLALRVVSALIKGGCLRAGERALGPPVKAHRSTCRLGAAPRHSNGAGVPCSPVRSVFRWVLPARMSRDCPPYVCVGTPCYDSTRRCPEVTGPLVGKGTPRDCLRKRCPDGALYASPDPIRLPVWAPHSKTLARTPSCVLRRVL